VVPVSSAHWYGVVDGDEVRGAVLIVPGRLCVPFIPDLGDARFIGAHLRREHRACMTVGPREASDGVWSSWAFDAPVDRCHDQRLYVCDRAMPSPGVPEFRQATVDDLDVLVPQSAQMEFEDVGRRPYDEDPAGYTATIRRRVEAGQTWVTDQGGRIVFQINVGTATTWGAQVGGTYVPPDQRGKGLAVQGMAELGKRLIPMHSRLTLHVHEANTPAVRTYERTGYRPHAAFRLITLRTPNMPHR
jgi:GNAT superfamily N-acetyltransferase